MQLTPQEQSAAFWSGAKKGAIRSLSYIALLAVPIGALMAVGALPWISVTVGVISVLSTALTVGMFSGHNAVAQYHQQKHNTMYEAKLAELEGRAQTIETPEENRAHLQYSPKVTTILEQGSRKSFADTEEERAAVPQDITIH